MMNILGIETSCDETAVSILACEGDHRAGARFRVLGNALHSQAATHAPFGGVFPNLAKREHQKNLVPLLTSALEQAGLLARAASAPLALSALERESELQAALADFLSQHGKPDIDAIAVTHGPGLEPALWVGVNFARALAMHWSIPLVAVNHMEGHIVSALVGRNEADSNSHSPASLKLHAIRLPLLSLLISGGHTELVLSREWMEYERIGETRDDAAGEAFDKVARLLDLPYPGGPEISRLAAKERNRIQEVTPLGCTLPRPMLHESNYDFSFSGLKTAVLRLVQKEAPLTDEAKMAIAREFEDAVADVLVGKTLRAVQEHGARTLVVSGGVSANAHIREELGRRALEAGCELLLPPRGFETDNALMIALAGYFRALRSEFADPSALRANGNLRLETTVRTC